MSDLNLDTITGQIIAAVTSKTCLTAIATFLVAVLGPKTGLDPTTAYTIAGAIGTLSVCFLRLGMVKVQQTAQASGVTQETADLIAKVVGDVVDSKINPTPPA